MTEDRRQKADNRRPKTAVRHLLSVLKWVVFCLVIGGIAAHILIKIWFGPAYVSLQTKLALAEFWTGPVRVEKVDFHYDGVMYLRDIIFYDQAGAEVMKAGGIELTLGKWPSLTAPAKRIEVDRLDVCIRLKKGLDKFGIPIRFDKSFDAEQSILEHFRIRKFDVIVESNEARFAFGRMFFEFNKSGDNYTLYVGSSDESGFLLRGKGGFNVKSRDIEMNLKFAQQVLLDETKVLLSVMGAPSNWDCQGNIDAILNVKGNLANVETLWPKGTAIFDNWVILENQKITAKDVNAVLAVNNRQLELKQATGQFCKGQLRLSGDVNLKELSQITYNASIMAVDVNLADLTELSGSAKKLEKGTGLMWLEFNGKVPTDSTGFAAKIRDANNLAGRGVIYLDEADLWRVPVIGELFENIGVLEESFGQMSDAELEFRLSGAKLVIEQGRLSNSFSAIEAEKGGTIDMRNGRLDMYVVAMPVKEIDRLINRIPVVSWFVHFKNKLVRLRLKGQWSEPANKLISKQPLKDIGEGTIGFFMDVLQSGGHIAERAKEGLGFGKQKNSGN